MHCIAVNVPWRLLRFHSNYMHCGREVRALRQAVSDVRCLRDEAMADVDCLRTWGLFSRRLSFRLKADTILYIHRCPMLWKPSEREKFLHIAVSIRVRSANTSDMTARQMVPVVQFRMVRRPAHSMMCHCSLFISALVSLKASFVRVLSITVQIHFEAQWFGNRNARAGVLQRGARSSHHSPVQCVVPMRVCRQQQQHLNAGHVRNPTDRTANRWRGRAQCSREGEEMRADRFAEVQTLKTLQNNWYWNRFSF